MRYFKNIWESKHRAGTWIALEAMPLGKPFMFTFSRNGYAKQWFCNMNIFPLAISKNNSEFRIGLSLIKFFIGINFHLNFGFPVRKTLQRSLDIVVVPFEECSFSFKKHI